MKRVKCIACGCEFDYDKIGYCPHCSEVEWVTANSLSYRGSVEPGYEPLAQVLQEALDQAQYGKGKKCHANGKPFLKQPIIAGGRECGEGGLAFQARKKILEALNCKDNDRAIEDLLGAINYTAAMVIIRREK